jgi:hypothetical protein
MLYTAEKFTAITKILRSVPVLKCANPDSQDRNRFAVNVLRLSFSAPPSGDIYIARQSDRKNPIHNPIHLKLNFQPRRVQFRYFL